MLNVIVTTNPFDIEEYSYHECEDLISFIRSQWEVWPETARIYSGNVSEDCDITPIDERDIELLNEVTGTVYIVVYPGDPVTIIISAVAAAVISAAAFLLFKPGIPDQGSAPSSNNDLSDRSNKARPNSRIPDIYGKVRSSPDLIALPYRMFENNQEIEIAYMCVGRGSYDIEDVRDGDTLIGSIAGAGATFYGPNTSPNFGTPQLTIGSAITQDLYDVVKLNEVNGQTLSPPNNNVQSGSMRFVSPNVIERSGGSDFTDKFDAGQSLTVSGGTFTLASSSITLNTSMKFEDGGIIRFETLDPSDFFSAGSTLFLSNASYSGLDDGGVDYLFVDLVGNYTVDSVTATTITLVDPELVNADWDKLIDYASDETEYKIATISNSGSSQEINLSGTFTILSVSSTEIVLSNPEAINADYLKLIDFPGSATPYAATNLSTDGVVWVGWFDIPLEAIAGNTILLNVVASQGVYGINKSGEQYARTETVTAEIRPIDKDGTVTGATEYAYGSLTGSATEKKQIAISIEYTPSFSGRAQVRMRRTSPTDLDPKRQAIDELKWDSCYGLSPVLVDHFGNVTTVFTRTYATQSATAQKERRLNCLVTREVPTWNGSTFDAPTAQTDAAAIICAIAMDEYIGNRSMEELNVTQIYTETEALRDYFGFEESTDFCYTFDDDNISFEETVTTISEAVFSTAYRVGNIVHLYGEKINDTPMLLFNHRNKVPGSETRTVTFGNTNDYDGVELTYVSSDDDAQVTIYLPDDQSSRNPKKLDTVGIRNEQQAMLHANRTFNKIRYQNTTTQFEAMEEAEYLINKNLILVSDNTRTDVIDGEIKEQIGLILRLSQPFVPTGGVDYTIYIQLPSGAIDAIPITAGADNWHVVLDHAPSEALSIGPDRWVVALYQIVGNNEPRANAFILGEKEPSGNRNFNLTAINYDERYYQNDQDFMLIKFDSAEITFDSIAFTFDRQN